MTEQFTDPYFRYLEDLIDSDDLEAITNLLESSAATDPEKRHLLQYALLHDKPSMVHLLLLHTDLQNLKTNDSSDPVVLSVETGQEELLESILELGGDSNAINRAAGLPVIVMAVLNKRYDMCHLLIAYGCDVNATDELGRSALWRAAEIGDVKAVTMLLSAGAVQCSDHYSGLSPSEVARRRGHLDVATVLEEQQRR